MPRPPKARGDYVLTTVDHSARVRPAPPARVRDVLRRAGLSHAGIQQALSGAAVSGPRDRAVISRMLTTFASFPPAVLEVYDWPGGYAQRFDGVD